MFHFDFETKPNFELLLKAMGYFGLYPDEATTVTYYIYAFFINAFVSVGYVGVTLIKAAQSQSLRQFIRKMPVALTHTMIATKAVNTIFNQKRLCRMKSSLGELDDRVKKAGNNQEKDYLERIIKSVRRIIAIHLVFCVAGTLCTLSVTFNARMRGLCSVWFPFDWRNFGGVGYLIVVYQLGCAWTHIFQNLLTNLYPIVYLLFLKGHFRALNMRVARIGYDSSKSRDEKYKELIECIGDHKRILECRDEFEQIFGKVSLLQLLVTQLTLCGIAIYFYNIEETTEMISTAVYFALMVFEIFISCYCSDEFAFESILFRNALFSCNWMDQDKKFKRTLLVIMVRAQKQMDIYAGNLVTISMPTLLAVLKNAYSLFAILKKMR